jgi:hypothetical protein
MSLVNANKRQKLTPSQLKPELWFLHDYGVKTIGEAVLSRAEIAAKVPGFEWLDVGAFLRRRQRVIPLRVP